MKTKFWLSFLTLTSLLAISQTAIAQTYQPSNRTPVSDNTLGTQVSGNGNNFNITGGLNKGQTLFHSFTDFSVPTNGQANFTNPVGNRDIITRVTGKSFSDINGLVNTNGANFFLINPNGIVFGTNAQLNVGKAFVGSTANSIDLVDAAGKTFNFGVNSAGDAALLTVNSNVLFNPSKLIMGGSSPGSRGIENYGTLQTNNDSQYIGLLGGNVKLDGGKIIAPGGRVDLGGLNSAGTVTPNEQGLVVGGDNLIWSDVSLTNGAAITVRADLTLGNVNTLFNSTSSPGSSINIGANNFNLLNSGSNFTTATAALDAGLAEKSGIKTTSAGDIKVTATGKVTLENADIRNTIRLGAGGKIGDIKLVANSLDLKNKSVISASTVGRGNTGKISIMTQGDLTIDRSNIGSVILKQAEGDSQGISINARNLILKNASSIDSDNLGGRGNAGDINIKASGDIKISGYNLPLTNPADATGSQISSSTQGQGDAGKITIDTRGKLSIVNRGKIEGAVLQTAVGNGKSISIAAREFELANNSLISTSTLQTDRVDGKGNAGDIDIKTTGNIKVSGYNSASTNLTRSQIFSTTLGQGDAGKIAIDTQGKLSVVNNGNINSLIGETAVGNSNGIKINARELELVNGGTIATATLQTTQVAGKGNAGDIEVKTSGDIKLAGFDSLGNSTNSGGSSFNSSTYGQGDAGKITIDTQGKFSLSDGSVILSNVGKKANRNGRDISISAREIEINKSSFIISGTDQIAQVNGNGKSGDIELKAKDTISLKNTSTISTSSTGAGQTGNVSITAAQLLLDDSGFLSDATSVSGGNITIAISDKLLLQNDSFITTSSGSSEKNGNGGNITISSPLIIALPGNNDIIANAYQGTGGKVNITSQGLFGIQYRPIGSDFTSDITASSTFGQSGSVNIDTPGTDPGQDSTELPNTTTDASNQISQVCSADNRQNKLTVAGRGGLPPNANDPLTSDVVWQDARAVSSQPAVSSATTNPVKLAPPAVGWVFDGKGKVTLIAAGTQGQPTGTTVACPKEVK